MTFIVDYFCQSITKGTVITLHGGRGGMHHNYCLLESQNCLSLPEFW